MIHTVSFTGPRPKKLFGYEEYQPYKEIQKVLYDILKKQYESGVRQWISGGAQGFDQIAFWTVFELSKIHPDIKNTVYIPFRGQERLWREDGLFGQKEYRQMLQLATNIKCIKDTLPNGEYYSIPALMMKRNEAMINDSDQMIALYPFNMNWEKMHGGTANAIRYAHRNKKPIQRIDPFTKEIDWL